MESSWKVDGAQPKDCLGFGISREVCGVLETLVNDLLWDCKNTLKVLGFLERFLVLSSHFASLNLFSRVFPETLQDILGYFLPRFTKKTTVVAHVFACYSIFP
jgi:hypothetical protein